jgi:HAD superfamily hydrolase (TIGR01490 family)
MKLALFDLDGTLLPTDSDHAFGEFMIEIGWVEAETWRRRNDDFYAQYQAGTLDIAEYVEFTTSAWRTRPLRDALAARERFMREVIEPHMHASAKSLVKTHLDRGDLAAVVTATNEFVTRPIATAFGVEQLLAVELERDEAGAVTGRIHGTPTFRDGKVARVNTWLQSQGCDWNSFEDVVFYSDSTNDLPLLERARTPVATNPTPALGQIARERGWRILNLFETP